MLSSTLSHHPFSFGQCLQIIKIQPELCAFESCSFCKSIQNKDQILIVSFFFVDYIFNGYLAEQKYILTLPRKVHVVKVSYIKVYSVV